MTNVDDITLNIKVVKRDGKKLTLMVQKLLLLLKKDLIVLRLMKNYQNQKKKIYWKDIQKVYQAVVGRIEKEYKDSEKIKIETIQDMIEDVLQKKDMKMYMIHFHNIEKEELILENFSLMKRKHISF